jgi:hypothetical protein
MRYILYVVIVLASFGFGCLSNSAGKFIVTDTQHVLAVVFAVVFVCLLEGTYRQLVKDVAEAVRIKMKSEEK